MQIFKMRTFKSVEIHNIKYLQMCHQRREILYRHKRKMMVCGFMSDSYKRFIIAICAISRIFKKKKKNDSKIFLNDFSLESKFKISKVANGKIHKNQRFPRFTQITR